MIYAMESVAKYILEKFQGFKIQTFALEIQFD